MRSSWLWPTINLLATLITSVIVYVVPATPFQPYIVMSFVCFCPGMALVRFLRLNDLAVELSLAVALSLSVASIIAGAFLYSKHWSPLDTLTALVLLTLTCSVAQIVMQLPIVGVAPAQEQSDDVAAGKTMALAALKEAVREQQKIVKESTPQPLEVASSPVRKAAWGLEEAATTVIPAAAEQRPLPSIEQAAVTESHRKDVEKAATTIMPAVAQSQTKQSVTEKDTTLLTAVSSSPGTQKVEEKDTTLLAAVSSSPGIQKVEEKDTTLLAAVSSSPGTQKVEDKNTTLLPPAEPPSVEEKDPALTLSLIETQDTHEPYKEEINGASPVIKPPETPKIEEKKAPFTLPATELADKAKKAAITTSVVKPPDRSKIEEKKASPATPITKPPETPAIVEKKVISTAPSTEPPQPQEVKEKEHADKRPVAQPQQKAANRERDTDADIESNSGDLASPGETPHSLPALSSPAGAKPVLRKRRLLNQ